MRYVDRMTAELTKVTEYPSFGPTRPQIPIRAVTISWEREGDPTDTLKGSVHGGRVWEQMQSIVDGISDLPAEGYYKLRFEVTFEDQSTFSGTLCLDAHRRNNDIAAHVRAHCEFMAGRNRPEHLSPERYQRFLANVDPKPYEQFLAYYQIGEP